MDNLWIFLSVTGAATVFAAAYTGWVWLGIRREEKAARDRIGT